MIRYQYMDSPVEPLLLAADDDGLHLIEFHSPRHPMARLEKWVEGKNYDMFNDIMTDMGNGKLKPTDSNKNEDSCH